MNEENKTKEQYVYDILDSLHDRLCKILFKASWGKGVVKDIKALARDLYDIKETYKLTEKIESPIEAPCDQTFASTDDN